MEEGITLRLTDEEAAELAKLLICPDPTTDYIESIRNIRDKLKQEYLWRD